MFPFKKHVRTFKSRRRFLLRLLLLILAVLLLAAFDFRLSVRSYTIDSPKVSEPLRIALITDLHSCRYGNKQENLIRAIDRQKPDAVLLGGDIFDDVLDDENTETFLKGIAGHYPCFYVTGNHECWSGSDSFKDKMQILDNCGIPILSGEYRNLTIKDESIRICGIDDPDFFRMESEISHKEAENHFIAQLDAVGSQTDDSVFSLLLSHRPEYFSEYLSYSFDLVLCGHAHGGQWRIPLLLNGLFAPDQGLFPKYTGGRYDQEGTCMIVSRGLARESTHIPRIFNRPELVIVDIS